MNIPVSLDREALFRFKLSFDLAIALRSSIVGLPRRQGFQNQYENKLNQYDSKTAIDFFSNKILFTCLIV